MDESTLTRRLCARLEREPDAVACRLLFADGPDREVTVGELMGRASAFARALGPCGSERREVAVCLYHSLDLHAAFVGALLAGWIPTMLAPPSPRMEPAKYARSFRGMLEHIRPAAVVLSDDTFGRLDEDARRAATEASARLLRTSDLPARDAFSPVEARADDVAVLQHSSGTTGLQKGVALSHRAILTHNRAYAAHLSIGAEDVIVSWLPLYHDMGFVACFLLPLLEGIPFVEISPFEWVGRPAMLLDALHRHRGTLTWQPNFAFAFLAQNVRPDHVPPDLDLRGVRAFVNCSEPVGEAAVRAFVERYAPYGAHWGQMTASYAMAENVFAVSQSLPGRFRVLRFDRRAYEERREVVPTDAEGAFVACSNGPVVDGTELRVLDERGAALPERRAGDLALRGEHRFSGYFHRDDATAAAMTDDGWYRTGDVGFVDGGEVFVTGRKKDLIIVQGRNFHPSDVEAVAEQVEGVVPGRVVAIGVTDEGAGTEGLVVLAEVAPEHAPREKLLVLAIRKAIAQQLDVTPMDVRVVPARWLVKSTSGKLARADNRQKYLDELRSGRDRAGSG